MKISNTSLFIVFQDFYSEHCCSALNCEYRSDEIWKNLIYKNHNIPASKLNQTSNKYKLLISHVIIEKMGKFLSLLMRSIKEKNYS